MKQKDSLTHHQALLKYSIINQQVIHSFETDVIRL